MATPADGKEFLELVRKSDVADSKRLDGYLQQLRAPLSADPARLAAQLVEAGLITAYQSSQILQGKWKRFSIGKYRILDQLGKGGMASVFLCEHKLMRRRVAVKVLPSAKANDPTALERFYREARAVAALDHPNIVHAYDIDQDESLHFLVMEYVEGSNLQDIVRQQGPLDVAQACHYIRQTAQGLDHAHQRGMVHRDIKPSNLLVDRKGQVKILDMGLARFFRSDEPTLTKKFDESVLGSVDYLSPEQAEDSHDVDIRADIYSLGATLYFLLTGQTLFGEGTGPQKLMWHLQRPPRPISEFRSDVPQTLWLVIAKMLAKSPARRYQVPSEVADALLPFVPESRPPDKETRKQGEGEKEKREEVEKGSKEEGEKGRDTVPSPSLPSSPSPLLPSPSTGGKRVWLVTVAISIFLLIVLFLALVKYAFFS